MASLNTIRTTTLQLRVEGEQQARSALDSVADAEDRRARAATTTATTVETSVRRQLSAGQALEKLNKQIDADYRASENLRRASGTIDRAVNQGLVDQAERDRLMSLATVRYAPKTPAGANENDPTRRGLSTYDRQFIRYQGFDVASSLSSGANPLTVFTQQGVQVAQQLADRDGGLTAGLKQLGTSALGLVTPFTVAATATAGAVAAFAFAAKSASDDRAMLERATTGLGRGTGATASQLDAIAQRNAEAGKTSVGSTREMAAAFSATGQIGLGVFDTLIAKGSDFAKLVGQDLPTATSTLAAAFADPARGADDLASKIGGLDDRTRELIRVQAEQGDKSGAQATMAEYLRTTVEANTAATSGWATAWNAAAAAAGNYWEAAKRIAGIKLGIAPEGAQEALTRLNGEIERTNKTRTAIGMDPLGMGDRQIRERDTAALLVDTERREAEGKAAEERASKASRVAGDVSRAVDPNYGRLQDLISQQSKLRDALADPEARARVADLGQVEDAYTATTRAISTMTDASGKLLSAEEMSRRGDALKVAALNARTDAQKADIAAQQRGYDLIGKALTPSDARGQIDRARQLSLLEAASKAGGSGGDSRDDFDRAVRSAEDRTRRQMEENRTLGMGADAVARFRVETELLNAAKRAERDLTPELSAQIQGYADKAAAAAGEQAKLRDSMRDMDDFRGTSRSTLSSFATDLARGTGAADAMTSALDRIKSKVLDIASSSLVDSLFGKTGTSGTGLLGGLFGGSGGMGASIASVFGFASGGFTGHGGRLEPAGIVHRGEYVFDAVATSRIGIGALEAMRSGLRGYAEGGPVGDYAARSGMLPPKPNATSMDASPTSAVAVPSVSIPIVINMQGSSGDAAADRAHAEDTAKMIDRTVEARVKSVIVREMRPGGALWSGGARLPIR